MELRNNNASPGNTVLQTRSALVQRDGDIVDVDGISAVTFNNIADGNYTVTIRHRNHLGLSTDPLTNTKNLTEKSSIAFTTKVVDLRTFNEGQLFGDAVAFTTTTHPTLGTINMLWAGNVNANTSVRYTGPGNDNSYLLTTLLNGDASTIQTLYSPGDLNLNRTVRYTGPGNDNSFLLTSVLSGNASNIISQQTPN